MKEQLEKAESIFCKAMLSKDLECYDVIHYGIVDMYEAGENVGIEHMMDLTLGTRNRGYVRTALMTVNPIKDVVSREKWDKMVDFLKDKG